MGKAFLKTGHFTIQELGACIQMLRMVTLNTIKVAIDRRAVKPCSNTMMHLADALRLESLLRELGLLGLVRPTPASILSSLAVRTSVKPHDQFYGIQSVFGMKMQGDYSRAVESVQAEFLGHIWTAYAPALCLALNEPVSATRSGTILAEAEDTLIFFSTSCMQREGMYTCMPLGYSKVKVSTTADGDPIFISSEADSDRSPWRYEVRDTPPVSSKISAVYFGLPVMQIRFEIAKERASLYETRPDGKKEKDWKSVMRKDEKGAL